MGEAREVMDRITAATLKGDRAAVAECYAEDAVLVTPDAGELRGREAIVDYFVRFSEGFPDADYEYTGKVEEGNAAIDVGYFTGTHTGPLQGPSGETVEPTGRRMRIRGCDILQVEGGLGRRHEFFYDRLEFMEQLGLLEVRQPSQ